MLWFQEHAIYCSNVTKISRSYATVSFFKLSARQPYTSLTQVKSKIDNFVSNKYKDHRMIFVTFYKFSTYYEPTTHLISL
jgi:hypothetical protein